jgi:putative ABC transport system permease protein
MNRFTRLIARRRVDRELAEEIQAHLDEKAEALVAEGLSREDAVLAARRSFGNVTLISERGRAVWEWPWIETGWADLRYACRQLRRRPGFTAIAVLSTALGIGATTAVFAVVYGVLVTPYPYRDLDRLVHLHVFAASEFLFDLPLSSQQFETFARSPVLDGAMAMDTEGMAVTGGEIPEPVNAGYLSPNAFEFLGVPPLLGRVFTPDDARNPTAPQHIVVLSYRYWQAHYAGQSDVVGLTLSLDHQRYDIVGVMPQRFAWWNCDVYLPLRQTADPDRLATVFARVKPGVNDTQAEQQLQRLVEVLGRERPDHFPRQFHLQLLHMRDIAAGSVFRTILLIGGAASLLLLIGCTNVSILLLARGSARSQELAIRTALGASRGRLVRQLLTESVLIALGGGVSGILFACYAVDLMTRLIPAGTFPAESVIAVSGPVLAISAAVAIVTGVVFGLWPALHASPAGRRFTPRTEARTLADHRATARTHNLLIGSQVALTVVLLSAAGATTRALYTLLHASLNYDPSHVVSIRVDVRDATYVEWRQRAIYYDRIRQAVADSPGVVSAAVSLSEVPPALPFRSSALEIPGRADLQPPTVLLSEVSAGYFATLKIPILRGRSWTDSETRQGSQVAVINASMASRYWPGGDPLRQRIHLPDLKATSAWALASPRNDGWLEIVGIAADTPNRGLKDPAAPAVYFPFTIVIGDSLRLVARTSAPPPAFVRTVAERLRAIDPDQPINEVRTADEVLDADGWAPERFWASLFTTLGITALFLAAAGLYSVVSYVVSTRKHDFGIRQALGAQRLAVVRMVVGSALEPIAAGLAAGLALGSAFDGPFRRWTQDSVRDPYVVAAVVIVIVGVAMLAAVIPAYRAASIDPMSTLRSE